MQHLKIVLRALVPSSRSSVFGGLILLLCLSLVMPSTAAALGPNEAADPTKQASCVYGSQEDLTGDMFADGLLTVSARCFLNDSSALSAALISQLDLAIDIVVNGSAPDITQYFLYRTSNSSATCQTPTFSAMEHGPMVKPGGATYPASAGGVGFPTNFVEYTVECPFTVFTAADWTQLSMGSDPLGLTQFSINNLNATGYVSIDFAEVVRPGLSPGLPFGFYDLDESPSPFDYPFPPASACAAVDYDLQVNGTGYDLVQLQDVVVYPSDKIILIVDMNGGYPADLNALSFKYRAQPQDLFFRQAEFVDQALDELFTYKIEVKDTQAAALIEIECTDNAFLTDYTTLGDMNHSDTPEINRACASLVVAFPETSEEYATGDAVAAAFTLDAGPYVGGDTGVDVDITNFDFELGTAVTTLVESFDRFGSQIGGDVPYLHEVPFDSSGELRFLMPRAGDPGRLTAECTDSVGTYKVKGSGDIVSGTFVVEINQDGKSCYEGVGMKWKSPNTWPIGFVRAFGCLAEDLMLPDVDTMTLWLFEMQEELEDKPPFLFFAAVLSFGQELSDGFGSGGDGCLSPIDIEAGGTTFDGGTSCIGSDLTVTTSQRSTMALFIIGPIYLAIASHALGLVREK